MNKNPQDLVASVKCNSAVLFAAFAILVQSSAYGQTSLYSIDVRGDAFALTGDGAVLTGHELRVHGLLEVNVIEDIVVDSSLSLVYDSNIFSLPRLPEIADRGVTFEDVGGTLFADGSDWRGTIVWDAENGSSFGLLGEKSSIVSATAFIYWPGSPEERVFLGDPDARRVAIGTLVPEPSGYSITTLSCLLLSVFCGRVRRQK